MCWIPPAALCLTALVALVGCGFGPPAHGPLPPGITRQAVANPELGQPPAHGNSPIELSYLRAGPTEAPRVIFVHGTPGDATNYLAYLSDPPAQTQVFSIDRPGFGQSPADGDTSLTFAGQAAAIAPLLVTHDGRPPILVGHSLGGPIVCRLAADYPDRVGGLVILAGSVDPQLEKPRWYNILGAVPPLPWLIPRTWARANDEVFAAPQQTRLLAQVLPQIRCPVVVVQGGKDRLVPAGNADYIQTHLPNASYIQVHRLPNAGHFLPWQHEDVVRNAIDEIFRLGSYSAPSPDPEPSAPSPA
ncbi:MAG: alpha/beta hydrolase [Planctomycetota bacterium]